VAVIYAARREPPKQPKRRKRRRRSKKRVQDEIIRRLLQAYPPDGDVGNASISEVHRLVGIGYSWSSVKRALARSGKLPKK
jgi:hypothetical protein